jgi:apolipoprotein N-acyltransferase
MYSWFGITAASLVGPYGFITVLGPAVGDAFAFAFAAAAASIAFARAPGLLGPFAGAAAFAICEWLRSVGMLGVPFAQIGYSQATTIFAALAAYGGSIFITFVVGATGAVLAASFADRTRSTQTVAGLFGIAILTLAANVFWPARHALPATIPVSAIQGNIKQQIKWDPQSFYLAFERYVELTRATQSTHPQFVLWPETVITVTIGDDDALAPKDAVAARGVRKRFATLAQSLNTTIAVGSLELSQDGLHNALYFFSPSGMLEDVYRKRQLVPYAEWIPAGSSFLKWFPYLDQLGREVPGHDPSVVAVGQLDVAPLICWESAFSDVVHDQIVRGASMLAISTDDAWFGESAGPYQHAQIAQIRAIESGRWVLRAAATGISGIIAPSGHWTQRSNLDEQIAINGFVGPPVQTLFATLGPWNVAYVLFGFYVLALVIGWRWSSGSR